MAQQSITLQTSDADVVGGDVLGRVNFAASNESSGSEAKWIGASVFAEASGEFTATVNPTNLVFATSDADGVTPRYKITNVGHLIPNVTSTYNIGSSTLKVNNIFAATGTLDRIVTTGIQLTGSVSRSGLLFVNNSDLVASSPNVLFSSGDLASPKLIFRASGSLTPDVSLNILTSATNVASGVQTLSVQGSAGELFSITDVLDSGTIFSVNDISGLGLIEADANGTVTLVRYGSNVAVGNITPTQKLHVAGNLRVSGAFFDSTNSPGTSGQVLVSTSGGTDWRSLGEITGVDGVGTSGYVARWTDGDTIGTGIIYDNGTNIGIGDTNPSDKLVVNGRTRIDGTNKLCFGASTGGWADIGVVVANSGTIVIRNYDGAAVQERMRIIGTNGNVGINSTSPTAKLHIETGAATTTGVIVRGAASQSADLQQWQNSAGTMLANIDSTGNLRIYDSIRSTQNSLLFLTPANAALPIKVGSLTISSTYGSIDAPMSGLYVQGNAGIGTTAPATKLDVVGDFAVQKTDGGYFVNNYFNGNTPVFGYYGATGLIFATVTTRTGGGYTERIRFDNNGNVGIGTAVPSGKLHVVNGFFGTIPISTANLAIFESSGDNGITIGSKSDGLSRLVFGHGTFNNLQYIESKGSSWHINYNAFNNHQFAINGSEKVRIDVSGNIGIGTTSPTQKLDVRGSVFISGALYDSTNSAGTNGQVLTSTTTGTDWKSLSEITGVDGVGTSGYIARWIDTDTIGTGIIYDNGTNVGIGTTSPAQKLSIFGGSVIINKTTADADKIFIGSNLADAGANDRLQISPSKIKTNANTSSFTITGDNLDYSSITLYSRANVTNSGQIILQSMDANNTQLIAYLTPTGLGIGQATPTSRLHVQAGSATATGVIVRGAASQTADLLQIQNSAGTTLLDIDAAGSLSGVGSGIFMGRVGISNSSPQNLLTIGSGIGTGLNVNSTVGYGLGIHHSGIIVISPETAANDPTYNLLNLTISKPGNYWGGQATIDFNVRDRGNNYPSRTSARITGGDANGSVGGGIISFATALNSGTVPATAMTIINNGNVGVGVTPSTVRLQVRGSGNSASLTDILRIENADGSGIFTIRDNGTTVYGPTTGLNGAVISSSDGSDNTSFSAMCGLRFRSSLSSTTTGADHFFRNYQGSRTYTSGAGRLMEINGAFAPTSGNGTYETLNVIGTINQTGGSNGAVRGIYVNQTLASVSDYRAIEANNNVGWAFFAQGTAASHFNGNVGIGTTSLSTGPRLFIVNSSATVTGVIIRGATSQTADLLQIQNSAGVTLLDIDAAGSISGVASGIFMDRVGVGTSAPISMLHVISPTGGYVANFANGNISVGGKVEISSASPQVVFVNNASVANRHWVMGTNAASDTFEIRASDNGSYTAGTNAIAITQSGALILKTVFPSGDIGIGTTSPTQRLHVSGNMRLTGAFFDNLNVPGASGQVLVSTSGGVEWRTSSGGTIDGTGSANYLARWIDADTLGTGVVFDNGTNVGIRTTSPSTTLDVRGSGYFSDSIRTSGTLVFASGNTGTVGVMQWDNGEGTVTLGLKGGNVTANLAQDNVILCYNGTGSSLAKGQVVYVSGAQGQRPSVNLALGTSDLTSARTIGLVDESIGIGAEGFVSTFGVVTNLDTSAFTAGSGLWLSPTTPGAITMTRPVAPNHGVFLGWCLNSHASAGRIFVEVQNGLELEELHDVLIQSVASGNLLQYDSSNSTWRNRTPLQAGLVEGVGTSGYVARWTGVNTAGTGVIYDNGTNVGVGTTSPTAKLHVVGSGQFTAGIYTNNIEMPYIMAAGRNLTNDLNLYALDAVDSHLSVTDTEANGSGVIIVGDKAGVFASGVKSTVAIGNVALASGTNAPWSVFIGRRAGYTSESLGVSVGIGASAFSNAKQAIPGNDIGFSVAVGYAAGANARLSGRGSTFIGSSAGQNIVDSYYNTFVGINAGYYSSGLYNTVGIGPVAFGNVSPSYTDGTINSEYSVGIGPSAGSASKGFNNSIAIGRSTGAYASGNNNIYFGVNCGLRASGSYNFELLNSGTSLLGYTTSSNKLHINRLIAGDFETKKVAIGNITSANLSPDATLEVLPKTTTDVGVIIQGVAAQTADLFQVQNSAGATLLDIDAAGSISGVASGIFDQNLRVANIPAGTTETDVVLVKTDGTFVKRPSSSLGVGGGSGISNEDSIINALIFG